MFDRNLGAVLQQFMQEVEVPVWCQWSIRASWWLVLYHEQRFLWNNIIAISYFLKKLYMYRSQQFLHFKLKIYFDSIFSLIYKFTGCLIFCVCRPRLQWVWQSWTGVQWRRAYLHQLHWGNCGVGQNVRIPMASALALCI